MRSAWRGLPALLFLAAGCELLVDGHISEVGCEVEGAVGPPACPAAYTCTAGACVPSPIPLGGPCTSDAECNPGDFCLDPTRLGGTGDPFCTRTCCTSGDCDAAGEQVCWIPPSGGGNLCWPAAAAGRGELGTAPAWASCVGDGDCRSGRCETARCVDTCCSDTSCLAGDGACRFAVAPTPDTGGSSGFWCAPADVGAAPRYAPCSVDADCASGLCVELGVDTHRCSSPCCGSEDCEGIVSPSGGLLPVSCVTLPGEGGVRACAALGGGDIPVGVACVIDADCRSGSCVGDAGQKTCTDTCCYDTTCGNPASLVCRPVSPVDAGAAWALQCEPK